MGIEAKTVVLGLYFNDPSFGLVQSFTMRSKDKSARNSRIKTFMSEVQKEKGGLCSGFQCSCSLMH